MDRTDFATCAFAVWCALTPLDANQRTAEATQPVLGYQEFGSLEVHATWHDYGQSVGCPGLSMLDVPLGAMRDGFPLAPPRTPIRCYFP